MALLNRKTDEEKETERLAKAEEQARLQAQRAEDQARAQEQKAAADAARAAHLTTLTKWEYQVKRVGEDKQKGLTGSTRMEQIFNAEGAKGWELVMVAEERAMFKRPLPPSS